MDSFHDPPAAGPLVSVIMIFLNAERFITSAIESVLAQTYAAWELVLVDDGSTDGSSAIARRFAQLQPARIRLVEHEGHANRGMSASRNLGLRQARGAYIALLDADDVYLPAKLERQVAILQAQPEAAMVYGATLHWFSWTAQPRRGPRGFPPQTRGGTEHPDPAAAPGHALSAARGLATGHLWRADSPRGLRAGGWVRGSVPRHVRGSGLLLQALPERAGLRRRRQLGPLPSASRLA